MFRPVLSCPSLSCCTCPVPSRPVLSCPVLSRPVPSCPAVPSDQLPEARLLQLCQVMGHRSLSRHEVVLRIGERPQADAAFVIVLAGAQLS